MRRAGTLVASVAALFVGVMPNLRAQAPSAAAIATDAAAIRKLLQSAVLSEQAWGAWFAGQTQRKELIPELIRLGSIPRRPDDWTASTLTGIVLDALVQLKAVPEPVWTMGFFERWPVESLILLSNAGDQATPQLLELTKRQTGLRWLAAANLLLDRRPPGFAAALLIGFSVKADLLIAKSSNEGVGSLEGSTVSAADGIGAAPPGFPPSIRYTLTEGAQATATVLSHPRSAASVPSFPAVRPVYFMRHVYPPGEQFPAFWSDRSAPTSLDRFAYISALRGRAPEADSLRALESKTIVRGYGANIEQDVADYRAELTRRYERLLHSLIGEKLLTEAEAKALPPVTINVTVHDRR